jgi:hypothetical protein
MMTREQVIELGRDLARESEALSRSFHVKSDQHDILGYEAAVLAARSQYLETGETIQGNLRESVLLGAWGRALASEMPQFAERVAHFHSEFGRLTRKENR